MEQKEARCLLALMDTVSVGMFVCDVAKDVNRAKTFVGALNACLTSSLFATANVSVIRASIT